MIGLIQELELMLERNIKWYKYLDLIEYQVHSEEWEILLKQLSKWNIELY